jgi:hypothetical protein
MYSSGVSDPKTGIWETLLDLLRDSAGGPHLGCHVLQRATNGPSSFAEGEPLGEAEVCHDQVAFGDSKIRPITNL